MKRLTLAFMLLSFCVISSVAGPAPQSDRQTSGESKCINGFKGCKESLNDFKEAEQFMRFKATVLEEVNRLEPSKSTKPKLASVRSADVNRQKTGNAAVYTLLWDRLENHPCKPGAQSGRYRWSRRGFQRRDDDHVSI